MSASEGEAMTTVGSAGRPTPLRSERRRPGLRSLLLTCGIAGGALYPLADIFATTRYPGFSYRDQAVSELFAIGAPTSNLVVATIAFSMVLAIMSVSHLDAVVANQPTPWMGATERAAQYATNLWYAVFAVVLLRERRSTQPPARWRPPPGCASLRAAGLACGLLSALLYAAMLVVVPLAWSDYSSASQTVSELSAIDAPTRRLWTSLGIVWTLLYGGFGWAVWKTGESNRALRMAGAAIVLAAILGIFWPPMHLREVLAEGGGTLTDTLHIVWTAANGVLTIVAMVLGAAALGRGFRVYSIASIVVVLAAGVVTSRSASDLGANLPTPGMGVWERVNIAAWLLWVAVLSLVLLRRTAHETRASPDVHVKSGVAPMKA